MLNKIYNLESEISISSFQTEKKMKKWPRRYKLNLINQMNPKWRDLV